MTGPLDLDRALTLQQLRTFRAVADHMSFSAAAVDLRISQPSVSYQVKELETVLGLPLLDRLGKRIRLTEAGEILYGYARRTLNLLDEAAVTFEQIRGLLDSGLTTEIIHRILPFLACGIHLPAQCLTAETAELLEREAERLGQRIDCLSRNRDAILGYLAAVRDSL